MRIDKWIIVRSLLIVIFLTSLGLAQDYITNLISDLDHKDPQVRQNAAELLGAHRREAKNAVKPLIDALLDESPAVRTAAAKSLVRITKQNLPPEYDAWMEWWRREGSVEFSEEMGLTRELARTKEYLNFAFITMIIELVLIVLFIGVFSFMGGSKIKEMKDILRRVGKYISEADEVTKKSDKVIDELEQRRTEIMGFFSKLKEENQTEIERFSDLLQQNVEHRMREVTMNLREKAETELKQTLTQLRDDIRHEITRIASEQKEKMTTEFSTHEARFLKEVEAHTLFLEASFYFINAKYEKALRIYRKVLALKPDHQVARVNLGTSLKNLSRYNEALETYEEALKTSADDPSALYQMASTYALMKKKGKMLEYLGRAFQPESELKDEALNDESFKAYWNDPDFKNLAEG